MRRSVVPSMLIVHLVLLPFFARAQLSTRVFFGDSSTVYRAQHGGVPDSLATWLESDVDERPWFPGGAAALADHFHSLGPCDLGPIEMTCHNDMTVLVWFIVERDGSVREAWIDRGGCEALQQRTICYVLSMPAWTPGRRKGKPVRTRVRVPIHYNGV